MNDMTSGQPELGRPALGQKRLYRLHECPACAYFSLEEDHAECLALGEDNPVVLHGETNSPCKRFRK